MPAPLLPLLWQLFARHPNLLPAFHDPARLPDTGRYVQKPLYSREGENVTLVNGGQRLATGGSYGAQGHIYQALCLLPHYHDARGTSVYPCVSSWVVGDTPCGMGVRDDFSPITQNTSLFVPHVFR